MESSTTSVDVLEPLMSIMGETEVPVNGSVAQAVQFPAVAQCLDSKAMLVLLCHGTEAVRKGHEMLTTIFTSTSVGVPIAFGSTRYFTAIQNVGRVKSFVALIH
jgi:hypothetical protein